MDKTKLPYGRLTFDGNFCDIAKCREERWGKYCPDGACSQRTVQEWISVDDMLPEPKEKAICLNRDGEMMIGTYTEWGWMFPRYYEKPTHWMPLPEPPKGEAE